MRLPTTGYSKRVRCGRRTGLLAITNVNALLPRIFESVSGSVTGRVDVD
jgi:hypothetical protein